MEMEDKQLNINQPIPSVRRLKKDQNSKIRNSTPNKPPLPSRKSEPISNPGTIPFIWEQIPGTPKNPPENLAIQWPKMDPKLPRGKTSKAKKKLFDKKLTKFEEESDLDDANEADLDTADSVSQAESFSLNCSVSGVSGIEGQDLKPSTNQLTWDQMMGQFLPAAKAMAEETPVQDGAHVVRGLENDNKKSPVRDGAHVEIEEQESDDEFDKRPKSPLKVCRILPRFRFLNPIVPRKFQVSMSLVDRKQLSIYSRRKESFGIHGGGNNDDLGSTIVKNTLYDNTTHKVESQKQKSFSPKTKVEPSLRKNDLKIIERSERIKETHLVDSCKDTDISNIVKEVIVKQPKVKRNQELGADEEISQDLIDLKNKREDRFISFEIPVPPPLPKTPTDSWLCRTLPPTSSKNLSVRSKTTAGDLKLNVETMKVQNSDLRFSKEPLKAIPETE